MVAHFITSTTETLVYLLQNLSVPSACFIACMVYIRVYNQSNSSHFFLFSCMGAILIISVSSEGLLFKVNIQNLARENYLNNIYIVIKP